ncbi:MAG: nucleotide disphospho-sugar-binding domain-containing protein [Telluria sp.]
MPEIIPHYVVITVGSTGDIHPFMRLASAMRAIGRQVTFISHSYHARLVESAGIPFIGLGTDDDYLRLLANPDLWHPRKSFGAIMAEYREGIEQIDTAIRSIPAHPDLIAIAHPFAIPAAAIARERGVVKSIVATYLAPSNIKSVHDPLTLGPMTVPTWMPVSVRRALWRFIEKGWIDPVAISQINAARQPLGLAKVDSLLGHLAQAPDLSVTLFPAWFAAAAPDWPKPLIAGDFPLFDAAAGDGFSDGLSAFLAGGEKPIVFTPGTANIHAAKFFAAALAAVEKLGRRAIFLTRERAQVPAELPASVLWQPYVALSALLPRAAAIVHHGGIGTTAEALRAGIPQLVTPFAWDQFDNGSRIAGLGVGMVMQAQRLKRTRLARALQTLLTSEDIHVRCQHIAARFATGCDALALCRKIEHTVMEF